MSSSYGRPDGLLAEIVRGRQQRASRPDGSEKGEDLAQVSLQELGERLVGGMALDRRHEILKLSREPRPHETERLVRYLESGGATGNRGQAISDVYWALLNSSEFLLNH